MSNSIDMLLKMYEESPDDTFVLFALAKEHQSLEKFDLALEYFDKLLSADKNYVGAYYHLGKLYESKQEIDKAISTYKEGIQIASMAGDNHAKSELAGALMNIDEDFE